MFSAMNNINGSDVINSVWLEELGKIGWPSRKPKEVTFALRCARKER